MIYADPYILNISEGETVCLKALGDIHHGSSDSDEDAFISDLKDRPCGKTIYISLGDSLEGIGPAHKYYSPQRIKPKFRTSNQPILDQELDDLVSIISEYTKPSEWLGHISGNHPLFVLRNGVDLTANLCVRLGHRYLGYSAFVPIWLRVPRNKKNNTAHVTLMLLVHHGFGGAGARWEGSGINAYISHSQRYLDWDVALYGHRHSKWVIPAPVIQPYLNIKTGSRWVKDRSRVIAQCGTYLRTLSKDEYPSYSEMGGMTPRPIGCVNIMFKVSRELLPTGERSLTIRFMNV